MVTEQFADKPTGQSSLGVVNSKPVKSPKCLMENLA